MLVESASGVVMMQYFSQHIKPAWREQVRIFQYLQEQAAIYEPKKILTCTLSVAGAHAEHPFLIGEIRVLCVAEQGCG